MKTIRKIVSVELRDEVSEEILKEHKVSLVAGGSKIVQTLRRTIFQAPYAILDCGHARRLYGHMRAAKKESILCLECERISNGGNGVAIDNSFRPIDDLGLPLSIANTLKLNGIYFIGDLIVQTSESLSKLANFGARSQMHVRDALAIHGLSLGMDLSGFSSRVIDSPK